MTVTVEGLDVVDGELRGQLVWGTRRVPIAVPLTERTLPELRRALEAVVRAMVLTLGREARLRAALGGVTSITVPIADGPAAPALTLRGGVLSGTVAAGTARLWIRANGREHEIRPNAAGAVSVHVGAQASMEITPVSDDGTEGTPVTLNATP